MGNVNMEADQIHVRDNNHKTWRTVADALKALETSGESVAVDITELYTRDASRASKDDIANVFDAEQSYFAGDYVYYEGTLFKFTANHSGEWDPADVVIAQIGPAIANAGAVDYSTTEQPTGQKWIDGKDIYFKTIEFDTTFQLNPTSWTTITSGSNMDKLLSVMTVGGEGTVSDGRIRWHLDSGNVQAAAIELLNLVNPTITLYYTKTT